jgi:hypothetical protein
VRGEDHARQWVRARNERFGDPNDGDDARGKRGIDRASVRDEGSAREDQVLRLAYRQPRFAGLSDGP